MSGHTLGPWEVVTRGSYVAIVKVEPTDPAYLGHIARLSTGPGRLVHENARLIAAAPELLEALDAMLCEFGPTTVDDFRQAIWLKAKAAVQKATLP